MSTIRDTSRRPLTARSVIASTLLGVDPPRLPALALVRSGELFGLREGATRTALSRMASAGELVADDGHYVLSGALLDRHARQQEARRSEERRRWDGTWVLAVVTPERRSAADRAGFRTATAHLRFAEVREGLWARPDSAGPDPSPTDRATVDAQVTWVRGARPDDVDAFVAAFDLGDWADTARDLIAEMHEAQPALDDHRVDVVADTFVTAAAVLRHLVADPNLPVVLLPDSWPGEELRRTFDRFDRTFKATWRSWYQGFRAR